MKNKKILGWFATPILILASMSSLAFVKNADGLSISEQIIEKEKNTESKSSHTSSNVLELKPENWELVNQKTSSPEITKDLNIKFGWAGDSHNAFKAFINSYRAEFIVINGSTPAVFRNAWKNTTTSQTRISLWKTDKNFYHKREIDTYSGEQFYTKKDDRKHWFRSAVGDHDSGSVAYRATIYDNRNTDDTMLGGTFGINWTRDGYEDKKDVYYPVSQHLAGNLKFPNSGYKEVPKSGSNPGTTSFINSFFFDFTPEQFDKVGTYQSVKDVDIINYVSYNGTNKEETKTTYNSPDFSQRLENIMHESILKGMSATQTLKLIESTIVSENLRDAVTVRADDTLKWFKKFMNVKLIADDDRGTISAVVNAEKKLRILGNQVALPNPTDIKQVIIDEPVELKWQKDGFIKTSQSKIEVYDSKDDISSKEAAEEIEYIKGGTKYNYNQVVAEKYFQLINFPKDVNVRMEGNGENGEIINSDGYLSFNLIIDRLYNEKGFIIFDSFVYELFYMNIKLIQTSEIIKIDTPPGFVNEDNFTDYILDDSGDINMDNLSKIIDLKSFPENTTFTFDNYEKFKNKCNFNIISSSYYNEDGVKVNEPKAWNFEIVFGQDEPLDWMIYAGIAGGGVVVIILIILLIKKYWSSKARRDYYY
ncbi:MAG: hypothetical protein ACRC42_01895 [Mycoplasma sp.]